MNRAAVPVWPLRYRVERTASRHLRVVMIHNGRSLPSLSDEVVFVDAYDFDEFREASRLRESRLEGERDEAIGALAAERRKAMRALAVTLGRIAARPAGMLAPVRGKTDLPDSAGRMIYPTAEQVKEAGIYPLLRWDRFLPSPRNEDEAAILDMIVERIEAGL